MTFASSNRVRLGLKGLLLASAAALAAGAVAAPAHAQSAPAKGAVAVETVIVTAEKRSENVQDVPMSISAVSGDQLERQHVVTLLDLSNQIPNFQIGLSNNVRNSLVQIRGIGTGGTNAGIEPSVGVFIDGVYMPQGGVVVANLQDIATVEVLRGPQGTLYGRNTPVGALNITTRKPTDAFEALGEVEAGDYDERRASGYVGGRLAEGLDGRISAFTQSLGGYEKNISTNSRVDDSTQWGLRGHLRWTPRDDLEVNAIGYYNALASHCCVAEHINPTGPGGIATAGFLAAMIAGGTPFVNFNDHDHVVDTAVLPNNSSKIAGGSVQADWKLDDGLTVTSVTGYNLFKDNIHEQPGSYIPRDVAHSAQDIRTNSYSEELRVATPGGRLIDLVGGVYAFYEVVDFDSTLILDPGANRVFPGGPASQTKVGDGSNFFFHQRSVSYAAFGQAKINLTPQFRLIAGARYTHGEKHAAILGVNLPGDSARFVSSSAQTNLPNLSEKESKPTWLGGAQYDVSDHFMAYATVGTGYKEGGFNARSAGPGIPVQFGPENSIDYETGFKSTWFDRRLLINADIYRMDLKGFQASTFNSFAATPGFIVGNAGDRRVQGVELEVQANPIRQLSLNGSAAYSDATFTSYHAGTCPSYPGAFLPVKNGNPVGTTCDFTGLTPAGDPKWTWSQGGEWKDAVPGHDDLEYFAGWNVSYKSSMYLDASLDPRSFQGSVTLVDARLGVESASGRWRLTVWGRNLGNKSYYDAAATLPQAGNVSGGGTVGAQGFVGWYAPPRTYGVDLRLRY